MPEKETLKENDAEKDQEDVEIIVEDDDEEQVDNSSEESNDEETLEAKPTGKPMPPTDREETEEEIRERRRKEKVYRKERREKAIARDKLEMDFLRRRNEELEKRMMAQEIRSNRQDHYTVEQHISEAEENARLAEQVIAKAIAEANGDDAARAIKIRDEAIEKIRQLSNYRDKLQYEEKQRKQQAQRQQVDPLVASHAQSWMSKNDWYDSQGRDLDSRIVLAIDQSLVDEGYVPRTAQYWKELDRRVRTKLPHRYNDDTSYDDDDGDTSYSTKENRGRQTNYRRNAEEEPDRSSQYNQPKKGPPLGQSSDASGGSKKKEIYISKERKDALVQAGVWDDPVLRMRYIKRYQEWDKQNPSN